ncbi:hypothetical protein H632_c438p1 [Helicosporidium sp. ATCC 50920]|nr:hypothetical protein H632_c438p1 [Helicosporidium sp. ATCC 50920]|eukprot:KDD75917.1 hypothetical protein H632_c438p1 [Helicosporidium sp. ATCC 50920]
MPIMLARMACEQFMMEKGAAEAGQTRDDNATLETFQGCAPRDMEILCHAEVTKPYPPEWQLVQQLLLTGMNSDEARASFPSLAGWARERVTLDWVAKALSRMHINTFRVDTLPLFAFESWTEEEAEPASALEPFFPNNNAEMALRATRDVVPGEQLTICYVDETASRDVRRALLLENYGFECQCPRCVDGE